MSDELQTDPCNLGAIAVEHMAEAEERIKALESRVNFLDSKYANLIDLQDECRRLRLAIGARSTGQPMDLGHTFYPPGDPIPSRGGPNEHLIGFVYTHLVGNHVVVTRFEKNTSGANLAPGRLVLGGGKVDSRLTHDVEPNDYYYVEL